MKRSTCKWQTLFIQSMNNGNIHGTYQLITTGNNSKCLRELRMGMSGEPLGLLPSPLSAQSELSTHKLVTGNFPRGQPYPHILIPLLPVLSLTCLSPPIPRSKRQWQETEMQKESKSGHWVKSQYRSNRGVDLLLQSSPPRCSTGPHALQLPCHRWNPVLTADTAASDPFYDLLFFHMSSESSPSTDYVPSMSISDQTW